MEHCPTASRADNLEITGTGVATVGQHKRSYGESKKEKDHLFLSFTFHFFAFFLAETTFFVNPP